jgi:hypothetical protein
MAKKIVSNTKPVRPDDSPEWLDAVRRASRMKADEIIGLAQAHGCKVADSDTMELIRGYWEEAGIRLWKDGSWSTKETNITGLWLRTVNEIMAEEMRRLGLEPPPA